jgi:hypothetical protein
MAPKWAADINFQRWYRHPTKQNGAYVYASVSRVAKVADQGGWRIPWAALMTAEKAVESLATLQTMKPAEAVLWLKAEPFKRRNQGASKGTQAHEAMEAIMAGQPIQGDTPWIDAGLRFARDLQPEPEAVEVSLYCDTLLTAGTADFVGRLAKRPDLGRVLIDWKTSKDVYSDQLVQLAGYAMTSEYSLDDDGTEYPFTQPDTCLIVLLGADGLYSVHVMPKDPRLVRAFRACLELLRFTDAGVATTQLEEETPWDEVWLQQWLDSHPDRQLELATACREAGVKELRRQHRTPEDTAQIIALIKLLEMEEAAP